ncbi:GreA/GreB family elongation factor [Flavobacterium psychraquaticum]|uniref:GreA/GreB family elongation factor n=1 Tax=Flavobacterium psychraquaticum TaxID=3103958 RepID=UPI002ACEDA47|nr:GreA/GreB family elongation factor [Flavobacterium sp. LB-N7T]
MTQEIILTTGIYDLIKDLIRRKKLTLQEEERLIVQLKNAKQVVRKSLPLDVVTVDVKVTVKNLIEKKDEVYTFVAPAKAKRRNNTESIIGSMGLALVGCKTGDIVKWHFGEEEKEFEITNVERFA